MSPPRWGADMFDATDLEFARREHAYEMGAESRSERAWSRFYDEADRRIRALGYVRKCDGEPGLDGDEHDGDCYSIDGAYAAFETGMTVDDYIAAVQYRRQRRAA